MVDWMTRTLKCALINSTAFVILFNRDSDVTILTALQKAVSRDHCVQNVKPSPPLLNSSRIPNDSLPVLNSTHDPELSSPILYLSRDREPLNDYEDRNLILYGGFPSVFPLGQGCGEGNGPLNVKVRQWLMNHHSRRAAKNQRLVSYIHNMKMRSDSGKVMAATVRSDLHKMKQFFDTVNEPTFEQRFQEAMKSPKLQASKKLIRELLPVIMVTGAKIAFSPLERSTAALSELYSLMRYYNFPSTFFTIGIDETRTCIVARIACSQHVKLDNVTHCQPKSSYDFWSHSSGNGDPSDFGEYANILPSLIEPLGEPIEIWRREIAQAIREDPVAVALMCQRLVDALNDTLIAIPLNRYRRKTPKMNFSNPTMGALGQSHAYFWVTELQARKQLHWHILYWGGLPHWLSQRCAGSGVNMSLGKVITDVLETTFCAFAHPRVQALQILRRLSNIPPCHPAYQSPPVSNITGDKIREIGKAVAANINLHRHGFSCRKGDRGKLECRLAYGRAFNILQHPTVIKATIIPNADRQMNYSLICAEPSTQNVEISNEIGLLGNSDTDQQILDYSLYRPIILPRFELISDDPSELDTIKKELLMRQYHRLLGACRKVHLKPIQISTSSNLQDIQHAVSNIMIQLGMGDVYDKPMILDDKDILDCIRTLPLKQRIDVLDYLSQTNTLIGETSPLISAALGCNINSQTLVSTQASLLAMFYLVGYMTKDTMLPLQILTFVKSAKKRCNEFEGRAPFGEDPYSNNRPLRRLGQVVQNGITGSIETGIQQCALNVVGLPSYESSEIFWNIYSTPAIKHLRKHNATANGQVDIDMIDIDFNTGLGPMEYENDQTIDAEVYEKGRNGEIIIMDPYINYDDGNVQDTFEQNTQDFPAQSTAKIERNKDGSITVTSQWIEYLHRSDDLCFLSLTEYSSIINLVRSPYPETNDESSIGLDENPGRKQNSIFRFNDTYPLHNRFHNRISSILKVPKYGGIHSIPHYTAAKEKQFCEWALATLIPFPGPNHTYADIKDDAKSRFHRIMAQLRQGKFLFSEEDQCFHGPPGFEHICVPYTSIHGKALSFSQQCQAIFIENLAINSSRPSAIIRKSQPIWRARNCQQWDIPDPEERLFPEDVLRANHIPMDLDESENDRQHVTEEEIAAFSIDLGIREHNMDMQEVDHDNLQQKLDSYLNEFQRAYSIMELNHQETMPVVFNISNRDNITISPETIASVITAIKSDPTVDVDCVQQERQLIQGLPKALDLLKDIQGLNHGQYQVMKSICTYFDTLLNHIPSGTIQSPPILFVEGAGGTGKSYLFSCIERIAEQINLNISISATTGVACVAIQTKIPARTIHSLLHIPTNLKKMKPLSAQKLTHIKSILGNAILLIIDEIGFAAPHLIGAVDFRLREIYDSDIPFGGIGILFSGDFYQLKPVGSESLWESAFRYGSTNTHSSLERVHELNLIGTKLFLKAKRITLIEQMRCQDSIHQSILDNFRKGITTDLEDYIISHQLQAGHYNVFQNARIVSPGNPERLHMSRQLIISFARKHLKRVISWHLTYYYRGTEVNILQKLQSTNEESKIDTLIHQNPSLMMDFVEDAPVYLTSNMNPLRGLANGTPAKLYKLEWFDTNIKSRAMNYLRDHPENVILPFGLEPSCILVEPIINERNAAICRDKCSCVNEKIIIPIEIKKQNEEIRGLTTTINITVERPQVELGFITTIHKAQGATLDKVVASFLKRPCAPSREDFFAIYVLLSRIRRGDDFRALANVTDLKFVHSLKPPDTLIAFMDGYDNNGIWHYDRAKAKQSSLKQANQTVSKHKRNKSLTTFQQRT